MPVYLALLRGINVSGKNIIKMEDLRKRMEAAGYAAVKTFIQSGNITFIANEKSKLIAGKELELFLKQEYGYDITVFVITQKDLENAIDNNPFVEGRVEEESGYKKIYITFLSGEPTAENMEKLRQAPIGQDEIAITGSVLYFRLFSKASDSKLSNSLIESKLKLRATTRNWNTTLKLLGMMESYK